MDIRKWGPGTWTALHAIAMSFPSHATWEHKEQYSQFFRLIGKVLPCKICRTHYNTYLNAHPIPVDKGRDAVVDWSIDLHNAPRRLQGKPELSNEDARRSIVRMRGGMPWWAVVVIAVIAVFAALALAIALVKLTHGL